MMESLKKDEDPEVIYIPPFAYLRGVLTLLWQVARYPFRTTYIDMATGKSVDCQDVVQGSPPREFLERLNSKPLSPEATNRLSEIARGDSPACKVFRELLRKRADLVRAGMENTRHDDAILDAMDVAWQCLTPDEQDRMCRDD